jgi:hypothetical protein
MSTKKRVKWKTRILIEIRQQNWSQEREKKRKDKRQQWDPPPCLQWALSPLPRTPGWHSATLETRSPSKRWWTSCPFGSPFQASLSAGGVRAALNRSRPGHVYIGGRLGCRFTARYIARYRGAVPVGTWRNKRRDGGSSNDSLNLRVPGCKTVRVWLGPIRWYRESEREAQLHVGIEYRLTATLFEYRGQCNRSMFLCQLSFFRGSWDAQ